MTSHWMLLCSCFLKVSHLAHVPQKQFPFSVTCPTLLISFSIPATSFLSFSTAVFSSVELCYLSCTATTTVVYRVRTTAYRIICATKCTSAHFLAVVLACKCFVCLRNEMKWMQLILRLVNDWANVNYAQDEYSFSRALCRIIEHAIQILYLLFFFRVYLGFLRNTGTSLHSLSEKKGSFPVPTRINYYAQVKWNYLNRHSIVQ